MSHTVFELDSVSMHEESVSVIMPEIPPRVLESFLMVRLTIPVLPVMITRVARCPLWIFAL